MEEIKKTYEDSIDAHYLCIELESDAKLDSIATNVLKQEQPDFILPLHIRVKNDSTYLRYKLPENVVALKYANTSMKKQDFIRMYLGILNPLMEAGDWFLDTHSFLLDTENVYVDRQSGVAQYAYVPQKDYRNADDEIFAFLKSVFKDISLEDDSKLLLQLFRFFEGGSRHTLTELRSLLEAEQTDTGSRTEPPTPRNTISPTESRAAAPAPTPRPTEPQSAAPQPTESKRVAPQQTMPQPAARKPMQQPAAQPTPPQPAADKPETGDDIFASLFGDSKDSKKKEKKVKEKKEKVPKEPKEPKKHGGLFGGLKKSEPAAQSGAAPQPVTPQPIMPPQPAPQPRSEVRPVQEEAAFIPQPEGSGEVTVILSDDIAPASSGSYLELVSSAVEGAPRRIVLEFTGDRLLIGRMVPGEAVPDIHFPKEFKSIGRRHALIERREEGLFLVDLGSVNHTTLDGEVIMPNRPYPLAGGSVIGLTTGKPVKYRLILG